MRTAPLLALGAAAGLAAASAAGATGATPLDRAAWAGVQLALGGIAAWDLRTRRIPNAVTGAVALVAIALRAALHPGDLLGCVVAGAAAGAVFLVLALAARGGLGMGDVKLVAVLGLLLGGGVLPALVAGSALGAVASLAVLLAAPRGARRGRTLAYGPWLCAGAGLALLVVQPPPLL